MRVKRGNPSQQFFKQNHYDKIIEKPKDREEAKEILSSLSGHRFELVNGLAVYNSRTQEMLTATETCKVRFRKLDDYEIDDYISRYDTTRYAGAFEADGFLRFAEYIEGNFVLPAGLPVNNLIEFLKIYPEKPMLLIPDGADINYYLSYDVNPQRGVILFYGAMGSSQNINAFWRLYKKILPEIKKEFPDIKLLVVGSNPPDEIRFLDNGSSIIVTGFVEDVRPWLAQAWVCLIPLELGSGFRGRIIELMAMRIPVAGTHNALDSIGFESGKHGFISDSDEDIINFSKLVLRDQKYRTEICQNASEFVRSNYSLEATFGKLNEYLKNHFKIDAN